MDVWQREKEPRFQGARPSCLPENITYFTQHASQQFPVAGFHPSLTLLLRGGTVPWKLEETGGGKGRGMGVKGEGE